MELVFLGTSSAIPTSHRNHSAVALKAFGEIFLFDCGEGTQVTELGWDLLMWRQLCLPILKSTISPDCQKC